ncbi:hypothetical protein AA14337_3204 [Acetobacter malorum DSM 14337]|uniref:Phage protein n=1 Tax=Acetobacter malorum DSM 14337 TaxID=1307910 RepID=A0ABQ0Q096_9PROT|nr:hypothetical protein [Acetobacter malorum]KXV05783.1 hypothetical protein AD930_11720 [Acetobacter malorum]GBQ85950.1 hypothetical protein AA14337_3204 [Acetobacter malorum DSM 14337]
MKKVTLFNEEPPEKSLVGKRTMRERLTAIPEVLAARNEFQERCERAGGNVLLCADLMAQAITMCLDATLQERVGRDGRALQSIEVVNAQHCMRWAEAAYRKARGESYE